MNRTKGVTGHSVPSGTSYFLIETFNAFGQIVMNYPAYIAFVNSHSKGDGGAYHLHAIIDEVVLCFISSCRRQSCMIDRRLYPLFLKHLCHCFSLAAAHAINDAALSRMAGDEVEDGFAFFLLLVTSFYGETQVGTVER
mgnify:CR=1 FL=1